jgi:peptidoglycan/xylan/chitin deacetylase (PgdA/CDA1 family)
VAEAAFWTSDTNVSPRAAAKYFAYTTGIMDFFHRVRHGECLTVLMFHRVLPIGESERSEADPHYTVTPEMLARIVAFLKRNYSIVGVRDVLSSLRREHALPSRPALITFDDGWRDNLEWALPVLRGIPWVLFVATDAVSEPEFWWQEVLLWALRSGRAAYSELWEAASGEQSALRIANGRQDVLALLLRYAALVPEHRRRSLAAYDSKLRTGCMARHMLTASELALLLMEGVDVGSHGASHLPLSLIPDPAGDLRRAKEWLRPLATLPVMSFPHGRYSCDVVNATRDLGFAALFTSDPVLNACPDGWLQSDIIGRISLNPTGISRGPGELLPERLASQLYLRDVGTPAGQSRPRPPL